MKNSPKYFCKNKKIKWLYLAGAVLLVCSALTSILAGSTHLTVSEIFSAFGNGFSSSPSARIVGYVRLPRTLASLLCGSALAVSGAIIQNVLANRLASPSIIGVNSGAGLAVTLCAVFGILGGWRLAVFSFFGAFIVALVVSLGAKRFGASRGTVILMGVAMNSFLGAISDSVITLFPEIGVISRDFKVGEFSAVTYSKLIPSVVIILTASAILMTLLSELDVITLGEERAGGLGMNTSLMRTVFLILAALLAGCAVTLAGLLSFVGLMVPHAIRRLGGNRACHLIPLCAIYGGAFVCLCDTASRTLFSPYEIPVGIILAFLGAPFFMFILLHRKGDANRD